MGHAAAIGFLNVSKIHKTMNHASAEQNGQHTVATQAYLLDGYQRRLEVAQHRIEPERIAGQLIVGQGRAEMLAQVALVVAMQKAREQRAQTRHYFDGCPTLFAGE